MVKVRCEGEVCRCSDGGVGGDLVQKKESLSVVSHRPGGEKTLHPKHRHNRCSTLAECCVLVLTFFITSALSIVTHSKAKKYWNVLSLCKPLLAISVLINAQAVSVGVHLQWPGGGHMAPHIKDMGSRLNGYTLCG